MEVFFGIFLFLVCVFGVLSPLIVLAIPNFRWWSIWLIAEFLAFGSMFALIAKEAAGCDNCAFGIATLVVLFLAPAALLVLVSFAAKAAYLLWRRNGPSVGKNAAASG